MPESRVRAALSPLTTTLLLLLLGGRDAAEEDPLVGEKELSELQGKGVFMLENVQWRKCFSLGPSGPVLDLCERPRRSALWKWVSRHRLFNLGSSRCLGVDVTDGARPLGLFECDAPHAVMWWRCSGSVLYSSSQYKLGLVGMTVVVDRRQSQTWRRFSTAEGPCSVPYEEIYTLQGNSHGMPCALPFKYNNMWYSECTAEGREDQHLWCATTSRYDREEKWGFCPSAEWGCGTTFWDSSEELGACYQFNLYTIVTWSQAHSTCRAQGGHLLSIGSLAEQRYIRDRLADVGVMVWIGLNHLGEGWGWQWTDGSPLSLVNFTSGLSSAPLQANRQCGMYNAASGMQQWQSLPCESALPYICKKIPNNTRWAEPLENWQYRATICPDGFVSHNSFCYHVLLEPQTWENSSAACHSVGADLVSLHSLSEVELLITLLTNVSSLGAWIGLHKRDSSASVEWLDGSAVSMTLWHPQEHLQYDSSTHVCAQTNKQGTWLLIGCEEMLPAVCRTTGLVPLHPSDEWEEGCTKGWKRKGHSCYKLTDYQQTYEDAVKGYYCKAPLVTVEDRFEQAFLNSLINAAAGPESRQYWTALQDRKLTSEYSWVGPNDTSSPLRYTNWNRHQPVSAGGCVVMSGGASLGHWEVKNCRSHRAYSVCKQSVSGYQDTQTALPHIDQVAQCPPGWESNPNLLNCYKVFHDEKILMKRSWVEASAFCQALGTSLASFLHYEEEVFVKRLISTMFDGTEGRWFWVGFTKRDLRSAGAWEWSDGTPVVRSFIEDENDEDASHECAVYSDLTNRLTPQPCSSKYEWICKVPRGVQLSKPYWYNNDTEPWVFYNGAEYFLARQPSPWMYVMIACKMKAAELLSIHSRAELEFITERMKKVSESPAEWWIGLSWQSGGSVEWVDKTTYDFTNWGAVNWTDHNAGQGHCAYMSSPSGLWLLHPCSLHHNFVCKRQTISVLEIPRDPHYIGSCPKNWFYFSQKCFLLHLPDQTDKGKSWKDAESICSSFKGSLVAVENEIEQAYITMLLSGDSAGVWIGLQDESPMVWSNGKPVTYTNWSPVEPKSSVTEEFLSEADAQDEPLCTLLSNNHNFHFTGKWYVEKCSEKAYGFVCQKPQDHSKPLSSSPVTPSLDTTEYRNRTYKVVHGNMSWYSAHGACLGKDADLVSITDPHHQAYLTVLLNRLNRPHWIGLYSQDDGINYQWSDGRNNLFTHWDDTGDDFAQGDCVYMDVNGAWKRADCDMVLQGALCLVPPPKSSVISSEVDCPHSWVKFSGSCYSFESVLRRLSLEEAREHCRHRANSSDVLTIRSEEENRFVMEQLGSYGLPHQIVWLGISYDTDNALTWLDGSPLDFSNWHFKAPDPKVLTVGTCVSARVSDGVWNLADCNNKLGFICKTRTVADGRAEVEVKPLNGLHHGLVPAAVLVAILLFAVVAGLLWFVYKRRGVIRFRRLPSLGHAYYRQTSSQASDSDGSVLIADLEPTTGE
ncbi:secretory phospholipase A2 receptor isoform X2 [Denticeps clupeoides]|uniref:secretory phospholipase A2 receptor isoform X2 n=1 Tax=Denticeps clupeoides TaxID=299321 RepID=UPI0010A3ADD7|nr:secretory phospholipase A2 receptor isoform X2 [Denticeps clupeoides]